MKTALLTTVLVISAIISRSQVISQFVWNSNPLTTASVGPNATSVSGSALSAPGGMGGTNGLNPGSTSTNVNLTIPGSPTFDVPGIDIFVNFRREENDASFFTRGSSLDFGMLGGYLFANLRVSDGAGGYITVNSGNAFAIPDDHTFHAYHFRYDPTAGTAKIWFDGALKYTYNGTAQRAMYWTGSGNVVVGYNMDGTGRNITILDNLSISSVALVLPLDLLSFDAVKKDQYVATNWTTTHEMNVSNIALERSGDGIHFNTIKNIAPKGNDNSSVFSYKYTDSMPLSPINYYRLKITDLDGEFKYSSIKTVSFDPKYSTTVELSCYPNPATDFVNLKMNSPTAGLFTYTIASLDGRPLLANAVQVTQGEQIINIDLRKITSQNFLIVDLKNNQTGYHQSFKIIKK
ncbi:MAG: hypothetical protein C5B52_05500 [Bacteroidetes bacterium]|nr:MAG: hypothetical protein C5B52_05500 [Bacteroidota bacterium]